MKKIILFVIPLLLLLICNYSFGQNNLEDVVYLKNGEIVRGKIIQNVPDQSLRIQTKDRKVVVIKHDEIEKMTRENILEDHSSNISKTSKFKKKGFINLTEVNYNIGTGEVKSEHSNINNDRRSFGFRIVNGYQFNENLSLGLGIGIEGLEDETLLPITIDFRVSASDGKVSPVFILNGGTGIGANDDFGKLVINPQIGIRVYLSKNVAYLLNFGYKWQQVEATIYKGFYPYYTVKKEKVYFKYITISTGFSF